MSDNVTPLTLHENSLLPKDKHDIAAIEHLSTQEASTLSPLIPQLLTWLQDRNWPLFQPVQSLLLANPELAIEPARDALKGDDGEWVGNLLSCFVREIPKDLRLRLKKEIETVATKPTREEKEEEADALAKDILEELQQS